MRTYISPDEDPIIHAPAYKCEKLISLIKEFFKIQLEGESIKLSDNVLGYLQ